MELRAHALGLALALTACGETADEDGTDEGAGLTQVTIVDVESGPVAIYVERSPYQVLECYDGLDQPVECRDVTADIRVREGYLCDTVDDTLGCVLVADDPDLWFEVYQW